MKFHFSLNMSFHEIYTAKSSTGSTMVLGTTMELVSNLLCFLGRGSTMVENQP